MDAAVDVVVVGSGVVGAGVARDLALRGVRTLLVERKDFSAGTTGACSGMIHGGLRYLEFDVGTTRDSCADAGYIRKMAPHLIFRIPFLVPIYPGAAYGLEIMETVFEAYGRYSPLKDGKPSARLTPAEALTLEPAIAPGMRGALTLDEWGIDPFRLVLLNALDAARHGAEIRTHCAVTAIERDGGRVTAVRVRDRGSATTERIPCRVVVNAAGPWSPRVARLAGARVELRPGKGTHVIFAGRISNYALIAPSIDGRELLLVPHEGCTLLGTTDDDYYGDPDDAEATREEVDYLLQGAARVFPEIRSHRAMRVMAGVRPTLHEWGPNEDKLPREHAVLDHASPTPGSADPVEGLVTITGGKLATFRLMAQEATDAVLAKLGRKGPCRTHLLTLPGGDAALPAAELARAHRIDPFTALKMTRRHGSLAATILEQGARERDGMKVVCACEGILACELRHAVRHEMARDLADLGRRCRVGWGPCQGERCAFLAATILAEELSLPGRSAHRLVLDYVQNRFKGKRPFCEGAQLAQEELSQQRLAAAGYAGPREDRGIIGSVTA